jgi:membrane protein DedA with SNARE-associated domain
MTLTELLDRYGYVAVLVGTFFEGETVLILAGFAAHQGHLALQWVVLAAFVGSLSGDQLAYVAGRRYGGRILERFSRLRSGVERATRLLERYGTPLLLGFRFVYGIRNVTPFAAGIGKIPAARFVLLNVAGALAWSIVVAAGGYALGRGFVSVIDRAREFEEYAFVGIVLVGVGLIALRAAGFFRRRRSEKTDGP